MRYCGDSTVGNEIYCRYWLIIIVSGIRYAETSYATVCVDNRGFSLALFESRRTQIKLLFTLKRAAKIKISVGGNYLILTGRRYGPYALDVSKYYIMLEDE